MKKKAVFLFILIILLLIPVLSFAHPGRLDSNGGHYDRSTGTYHYHDGLHSSDSGSSEVVRNDLPPVNNVISNSTNKKSQTNSISYPPSNKTEEDGNLGKVVLGALIGGGGVYYLTKKQKEKEQKSNKQEVSTQQHEEQSTDDKVEKTQITKKNKNKLKYKCPRCGGELKIKSGKYGKFIGCSNYPNCKYTKKLKK